MNVAENNRTVLESLERELSSLDQEKHSLMKRIQASEEKISDMKKELMKFFNAKWPPLKIIRK